MAPPPPASCRLYVILARNGRSAVVFRRGPSRHVAILKWWLDTDTVELGQWFRGRIYERRCDLSPDGELLVYFAAKYRAPLDTWTAVSRPPFLTALALWPNGSAWGGGGLFASPRSLGLNHRADKMLTVADLVAPRHLKVTRYADYAGHGEDNPICFNRMTRDGWRCIAPGSASTYSRSGPEHWTFLEPEQYERAQPRHPPRHKTRTGAPPILLRRELLGIGVKNGAWYRERFSLCSANGDARPIANCEWADWDATGDLLFAARGRLYRLSAHAATPQTADPVAAAHVVADLGSLIFELIDTPEAARKWPTSNSPSLHGRSIPAA